ncbi:hypothetical protein [Frigoribacterium sp. Leaf186]|uniref:hypothetical protein n=1 Tax=Frigoribacterium sp. Leaf186 TaxID=1736293 RepID=UPI0006FA2EEF|nr:hypothetical protein [Frigoribacterium sp. Leaf186]KQS17093.1 hypothetical protein ASG05_05995 [Frigoribacterium sp. Leaf186]
MRAPSLKSRGLTTRVVSAAAVGAVVVLTAAGCNFISPQATTKQYDASDGYSVNVGSIQVRNAILLTAREGDGDTASLSMVVLNTSDEAAQVSFEYPTTSGKQTQTIEVDGSSKVELGTEPGQDQFIIDSLDSDPGALVPVFVQYGTETGKSFNVPVLTGALSEYATLLPSPTPSSDPTVESTPLVEATEQAPSSSPTP